MEIYCREGLHERLHFLAGIPLVTSGKVLKMIPSIPGVSVSREILSKNALSTQPSSIQLKIQNAIALDVYR